jgi:hypothetical protein
LSLDLSHTKNRSYNITAEVEIPVGGAEGPICTIGGVGSGWSFYIKDMLLVHCYNNGGEHYYLRSSKKVPTERKAKLRFEFEKTGPEKFGAGGVGRLYIKDNKVGEGQIPQTVKFIYSLDESFDIGRDTGSPVTEEYKAGPQFTGTIKKVLVDLAGERHVDLEAEIRAVMKRQ